MPIVTVTVPRDTSELKCEQVEFAIINALRAEGVQGGITVWFPLVGRIPGRLLLRYESRQDPPKDANNLARVAAEEVNRVFDIQVEATVVKLNHPKKERSQAGRRERAKNQ